LGKIRQIFSISKLKNKNRGTHFRIVVWTSGYVFVDEMTLLGCFMLMVHWLKVNRLWIASVIHLYILDEVRVRVQTRKVTRRWKRERKHSTREHQHQWWRSPPLARRRCSSSVRFLVTSSALPVLPISPDFFLRFFCFSFVLAAVLALFHVLLSSIAWLSARSNLVRSSSFTHVFLYRFRRVNMIEQLVCVAP
jgi:hypothetical protein